MKVKNENQQSLAIYPEPQIVTTIAHPISHIPEVVEEISTSLKPSIAEPGQGKFLKTVFESFEKHFDQVNIFEFKFLNQFQIFKFKSFLQMQFNYEPHFITSNGINFDAHLWNMIYDFFAFLMDRCTAFLYEISRKKKV